MSNFLHHEPCPECGSKDNLGVWDDGHKYCFGCGHYEHSVIKLLPQKKTPPKDSGGVLMPPDASRTIPQKADEWLQKYGITAKERSEFNFMWSQRSQLLIMPVYDMDGKCLLWQGRYFGDVPNHPKYLTRGQPANVLDFIGSHTTDAVVLVEDKISAIKVGRHFNTVCLYGSHVSTTMLSRLSKISKHLILWLDSDKLKEMYSFQMDASPFFDIVSIIYTKPDPKELTNAEIQTEIKEVL